MCFLVPNLKIYVIYILLLTLLLASIFLAIPSILYFLMLCLIFYLLVLYGVHLKLCFEFLVYFIIVLVYFLYIQSIFSISLIYTSISTYIFIWNGVYICKLLGIWMASLHLLVPIFWFLFLFYWFGCFH